MEIIGDTRELTGYIGHAMEAAEGRRVLIDKYFEGREVEVDAVCDGNKVLIPGIMEHIERAGVHAGDGAAHHRADQQFCSPRAGVRAWQFIGQQSVRGGASLRSLRRSSWEGECARFRLHRQ